MNAIDEQPQELQQNPLPPEKDCRKIELLIDSHGHLWRPLDATLKEPRVYLGLLNGGQHPFFQV